MAFSMTARHVFFIKKKKQAPWLNKILRRDSDSERNPFAASRRDIEIEMRRRASLSSPFKKWTRWVMWAGILLSLGAIAWLASGGLPPAAGGVSTYRADIERSLLWRGQRADVSASSGGKRAAATEESFIATYPHQARPASAVALSRIAYGTGTAPSAAQHTHPTGRSFDCGISMSDSGNAADALGDCLRQFNTPPEKTTGRP